MARQGYSFSVRRGQTHDGPGLRTTVFMKGCPLACAWCHNPESLSVGAEVWWLKHLCIDCCKCDEVCPNGATLSTRSDGHQPDRDLCTACGACVEACPAKARENLRQEWTVRELVDEVMRDRAFFDGGGVTVSGGEPLMQSSFVAEFLAACREEGLHTAIDTCGAASWRAFGTVLPHCDLVLYDLKIMDPEAHRHWTGQGNKNVLGNLRRLAESIDVDQGQKLWIRTPLVPGATDTESNVEAIGRFIRAELGGTVNRWELCTFNNLCQEKYERLGIDWQFADAPLITANHGRRLLDVARREAGPLRSGVILKGGFANSATSIPGR